MNWTYEGKDFEGPSETDVGFVYLIEELPTGKKYIGKKLFWKYVKRKPRGTKRVRRVQQASDWKEYYGSSNSLKERLKEYGKDQYKRTILHICQSKGMMSYLELKEQVMRDVLLKDDYYNDFIGGKISGSHLK